MQQLPSDNRETILPRESNETKEKRMKSHTLSTLPVAAALLAAGVLSAAPAPARADDGDAMPSWTDRITLKGDLRYRVEIIDVEDDEMQYRHRIRARAGIFAKILESLDTGLQLGTGGSDDLKSNNQTLTDGFASKPIWVDLAYFDWHPGAVQGLKLLGGKMKNPLYRVGKTELLWDPDLNPEGMALGYKRNYGKIEPWLQTVAWVVEDRKRNPDAWLYGAQAGAKLFIGESFYVLVGGQYIDLENIEGEALVYDAEDPYGNSVEGAVDDNGDPVLDDDGNPVPVLANDYNQVGGFVEVGGKVAGLPWAVFGDVITNLGADEHNLGCLAGGLIGKPKNVWDWKARYIYRVVEADAVYGLFTDSDFVGGDTGGKGHEINASLLIARPVTLAATYFLNQIPIDDGLMFHRAQLDLKIKF